ncbi:MAG: dihydrolipoamide dehydrogenase [Gammaproteobacteria bacterium]|jgi:dihydrolipoamide dehydrogenase|nr:dihydrolipoamide dehydrogenase [Gammaproteobacteria bacterium]
MNVVEVRVPEFGDAKGVSVVDVLVKKGSEIRIDDPLITLETEKASMDVPSPVSGVVNSVEIKKGDEVSAGTLIATVQVAEAAATAADPSPAKGAASPAPAGQPAAPTASATPAAQPAAARAPATPTAPASVSASAPAPAPAKSAAAPPGAVDLVVLGAGPGGYTAAFRAADLGLKVTLIERWPMLGGVCLNVGCIPSKALLHAAKVIEDAADMAASGIVFAPPQIDRGRLREWKSRVVTKLTNGLAQLAKQRKVDVIQGEAKFSGPFSLEVLGTGGTRRVEFKQCIIAAGSESARLPGLPDDPRVMDSTGALELPPDCKRLLVIGGGIIGLEMACVYDALGARVTVVELSDGLMPGTDRDLVRPLQKRIEKRYERILLNTKVAKLEALTEGLRATFDGPDAPEPQVFDRVLVAVGRSANGNAVNAAAAGVAVSPRGIIAVDKQLRTNVPHIFAIGDVAGAPMLAHKASHEGKVAAEVAAGQKSAFDARCIPSVAYTDPEIAWVGINETDAKAQNIQYGKGQFPWAASGRSLALNRDEGFTKILFDKETHRIIGAGIVGTNAGDLIAEAALAIEMGADAADIGLTIHAHPTLSETVAFAAEAFEGTLTDLYIPKR